MKRVFLGILIVLMMFGTAYAVDGYRGGEVAVIFEIEENPENAISARIGIALDPEVFEFVSAENISEDILNEPPETAEERFGLLNMKGLPVGEIAKVVLRINEDAPLGEYEIGAVVDSVYNAKREEVMLTVKVEKVSITHQWDDGTVMVPSTCLTSGEMLVTCLQCGAYWTKIIPVSGHEEGSTFMTVHPTCINDGESTLFCLRCDEVISVQSVPALGHTEGDEILVREATCTKDGAMVTQCATCGQTVVKDVIPALGHVWDDGVIIVEPTEDKAGEKVYTCAKCGGTKRVSVTADGEETDDRCPGDVNDDGMLDPADAVTLLQYASGEAADVNTINADVNADGVIDADDALLLMQNAAGWDVKLQ